MAETNNLPLGSELNVFFKFFIYDQIRDDYLTIEDVSKNGRRFHAMKTEWGFSKLLPLSTFKDSANGYLVDDCAIFGAEVFVRNSACKGENIFVINNPTNATLAWKIKNFSSLIDERITSEVFTVGGYQWNFKVDKGATTCPLQDESRVILSTFKFTSRYQDRLGSCRRRLSLYPDGDKKRNGKGHISLYLVLAETNNLPLGSELNVVFKFFVYDQIRDKYLIIEDVSKNSRRFHAMKTEWGFSKLLPLSTFNDSANGYLVDDCAIFGAEVFVRNSTCKGENISLIKNPIDRSLVWKIDNFSSLIDERITSEVFAAGGYKWLRDLSAITRVDKNLKKRAKNEEPNLSEQKMWRARDESI
ncbi:hypothetical protein LguiA_008792 [Lonicera macranthoides]